MFGIDAKVIIGFLFVLLLFFICRELICWYWKINLINRNLEQHTLELVAIKGLLKKILAQLKLTGPKATQAEESTPDTGNPK